MNLFLYKIATNLFKLQTEFVLALGSLPDNKEVQSIEVKPLVNGIESSLNDTIQSAPIPGTVPAQPSNTVLSENGLPIAVTAEEVKERCPPKAMIKPQVLTHVIEDFVIQESSEPFPIRLGLLGDYKPTQSSIDKESDEPSSKFFSYMHILILSSFLCEE